MKRSNAHEETLRAVLGMLFMYLCPHLTLVRRQMLKSPRASRASVCMCAVNETARLCHSLTKMQNMQDSYLKCFCGLIFIEILVHSASRFKCTDLLLINSSKLRHIPRHSALYGKFHYMTAFRDSARIFRIADIMGYIEVFCNFSNVCCCFTFER